MCTSFFFLSSHKSCTLILRKLLICAKKFRNNFLDVAYQTDDQLWLGLRTPNETFFFKFPKIFCPLCRIQSIFGSNNVWSAEKLTKRSTVLLLLLVSFSAEQTLSGQILSLYRWFLERWNSRKSVCNIGQYFLCLLDEWIKKICKKIFSRWLFI